MLSEMLAALAEHLKPTPALSTFGIGDGRVVAALHAHYALKEVGPTDRTDGHVFDTYEDARAWLDCGWEGLELQVFVGDNSTAIVLDAGHRHPQVVTVRHGYSPRSEVWLSALSFDAGHPRVLGQTQLHRLLNMASDHVTDKVVASKLRAVASKLEQKKTSTAVATEDEIGAARMQTTSAGAKLEVDLPITFEVVLLARSPVPAQVRVPVFPRFYSDGLVLEVPVRPSILLADEALKGARLVTFPTENVFRGEVVYGERQRSA